MQRVQKSQVTPPPLKIKGGGGQVAQGATGVTAGHLGCGSQAFRYSRFLFLVFLSSSPHVSFLTTRGVTVALEVGEITGPCPLGAHRTTSRRLQFESVGALVENLALPLPQQTEKENAPEIDQLRRGSTRIYGTDPAARYRVPT